mmetsp:Transcript_13074/g.55206  ORF Transcript_13074/g.55206 Transcript_13074/m.55206 type:complete len:321 (+) Transcript_13074:373-1335(+)
MAKVGHVRGPARGAQEGVLHGRREGVPRRGQAGRAFVHAARQGVRRGVRGFRDRRSRPGLRRRGEGSGDGGRGGGGGGRGADAAGGPAGRARGLLHRHAGVGEDREVHLGCRRRRRQTRGRIRTRRGRETAEGVHRVGEADARQGLTGARLSREDVEVSGRSELFAVGSSFHHVHARAHRVQHRDVLHRDAAAVLRARDGVHVQVVHHGGVVHRVLHLGVSAQAVVHAETKRVLQRHDELRRPGRHPAVLARAHTDGRRHPGPVRVPRRQARARIQAVQGVARIPHGVRHHDEPLQPAAVHARLFHVHRDDHLQLAHVLR